jgi:hypothetical protein
MEIKTVPVSPVDQQFCPKCRKTLKQKTNFYLHRNGGYDELCKRCLTMHIDAWDPDTFLWLLERFDYPYMKGEWDIIRDRAYAKDPIKFNPGSIFGKYLAKMRINQNKSLRWADTERLQQEYNSRVEGLNTSFSVTQDQYDQMKQALDSGEITEAQFKTFTETTAPSNSSNYVSPGSKEALEQQLGLDSSLLLKAGEPAPAPTPNAAPLTAKNNSTFHYPQGGNYEEVEMEDISAQLTREDKLYLANKWGRLYSAEDWVSLETLYNDFIKSVPVEGAARIDTLKMICKTSLKANQALDCGDIDSYQRLSRVYDTLMKSGKFTEAQKKDDDSEYVNSVGEIVEYCEKNGGKIPKYDVSAPRDLIDKIILDLKEYTKSLIYEDKALATEIENYLRLRKAQEKIKFDKLMGQYDETLTTDDLEAYNKFTEDLTDLDNLEEDDYESE